MQQDNNELLRAMYEEYHEKLRAVALRSNIPYDDVDDVIQEAFLAYFKNYSLEWSSFQKKAMIMRILKNKCVDYFRKKNRDDKLCQEVALLSIEANILTQTVMKTTLDHLVDNEMCKEVRKYILEMKKDWQDVAILHLVEGRSIKEVSQILKIHPTVCRTRIYRIRKYLREVLQSEYGL